MMLTILVLLWTPVAAVGYETVEAVGTVMTGLGVSAGAG